ncbi:hypothetical protein [Glycomyces sp. NRRL B-16210]|uniref:hypothetical protein n=1 Tax=Glycomyces sp. NRRL B-16210 TaxID=1463821 RepID=UPI0018CC1772|nr:hypothetical protein [Glycomyces sp. NRRL B-16210]
MLALVPEVYADGDPAELTRFADVDALKAHVLGLFAPTRFALTLRGDDRRRGRLRRAEAMRWLQFLAERTRRGDTWDPIAWWRFSSFAPLPTRLVAGILAVVVTVASFGFGMSIFLDAVGVPTEPAWWIGCLIGLGAGLALGGACVRNPPPGPSETQFEVNRDHLMAAVRSGLPLFLFVAVLGLVFLDLATSLLFAFAFAFPISLLYAVIAPDPAPIATHPDLLLRRDLRVGYVFGVGYAIPAFIVGYVVSGILWLSIVVTLATALAGGLYYGIQWVLAFRHRRAGAAAFVHLGLVVLFLAPRGLPWRVMAFLREAHRVGVLRREPGGTYRFRHSDLAAAIAGWRPAPVAGVPRARLESDRAEAGPDAER